MIPPAFICPYIDYFCNKIVKYWKWNSLTNEWSNKHKSGSLVFSDIWNLWNVKLLCYMHLWCHLVFKKNGSLTSDISFACTFSCSMDKFLPLLPKSNVYVNVLNWGWKLWVRIVQMREYITSTTTLDTWQNVTWHTWHVTLCIVRIRECVASTTTVASGP